MPEKTAGDGLDGFGARKQPVSPCGVRPRPDFQILGALARPVNLAAVNATADQSEHGETDKDN